ncbi:MAG: DUF3493 domain-containing protein [Cyanobacteria bacterium J06621_11]
MGKAAKGKADKKNSQSTTKSRKKQNAPKQTPPPGMSQARYDKLVAEANAPYKGFRKVIYGSIGASGAIGGFVFFTKILAGRDIAESLPNLALQLGVVALMVFLFRWEDRKQEEK